MVRHICRGALVCLAALLLYSCGCSSDRIASLINTIKEDESNPDCEAVGDLIKCGNKATDAILREWELSTHYPFCNFTKALCAIPSARRDKAFMAILSNYTIRKDAGMAHRYASAMIDALAENGCRDALPVLKTLARGKDHGHDIRSHAAAALGALNDPLEVRNVAEFLTIDSSLRTVLEGAAMRDAAQVMIAAADQAFSSTTTSVLTLRSTDTRKADLKSWKNDVMMANKDYSSLVSGITAGDTQYTFSGGYVSHAGSWDIAIVLTGSDTAVVYASYWRANLWGGGYIGKLVKRDSRWILTKWKMVWMS
jgi:hypothetical protein